MKIVNKILILKGKNYLSLIILILTLISLLSTSTITNTAIKSYNIQATSHNLVDLYYWTEYESIKEFNETEFLTATILPIIHVFPSQSSIAWSNYLSLSDLVSNVSTGQRFHSLFILSLNLSVLCASPFNSTIQNPSGLNDTHGVYINPQLIYNFNLNLFDNFSLYTIAGGNNPVITDSVKNITLSGELHVEDALQFMQLFGLSDYWEYLDSSFGVILMDTIYYEQKFRNGMGESELNIPTNYLINYIFDKTDLMDKKPRKIINTFDDIIQELYTLSECRNYTFYMHDSLFIDRIQFFESSFSNFQIFVILASFPIYLFGWWVNKTTTMFSLEKQSRSIDILRCKGVSRSDIKRKLLGKSAVVGTVSWILALIFSQVLSYLLRSYLFNYPKLNSKFFDINEMFNLYTMLVLLMGIGISILSSNSALNAIIINEKEKSLTSLEFKEVPRLVKKQSKKRVLFFWILSFLPLTLLFFPLFDKFQLEESENVLLQMVSSVLILLSVFSGFFFTIGTMDFLSIMPKKVELWSLQNLKKHDKPISFIKIHLIKQIIRKIKNNISILFIISIAFSIICQSLTYNSIVEQRNYQMDLIKNGNGLMLIYSGSNATYSFFNQVAEDIQDNEKLETLMDGNLELFSATNEVDIPGYHGLELIDPNKWQQKIDIPRNWLSTKSDNIYHELAKNDTILVSERFLEDTNYKIGDLFELSYYDTNGLKKIREVEIIGSYNRFPLVTTTLSRIPSGYFLIANINSFLDIRLGEISWTFFPSNENINLYEFYKLIRSQIYDSDPNGIISIPYSRGDFDMLEPNIPFFKYLQIESINLSVLILFGLVILIKRRCDISEPVDLTYRMKGMSRKKIMNVRFLEFIWILGIAVVITIPSYIVGLNSIIGINQLITNFLPFRISIPILRILLVIGIFIVSLLISYYGIILKVLKKTDRRNSIGKTIS